MKFFVKYNIKINYYFKEIAINVDVFEKWLKLTYNFSFLMIQKYF